MRRTASLSQYASTTGRVTLDFDGGLDPPVPCLVQPTASAQLGGATRTTSTNIPSTPREDPAPNRAVPGVLPTDPKRTAELPRNDSRGEHPRRVGDWLIATTVRRIGYPRSPDASELANVGRQQQQLPADRGGTSWASAIGDTVMAHDPLALATNVPTAQAPRVHLLVLGQGVAQASCPRATSCAVASSARGLCGRARPAWPRERSAARRRRGGVAPAPPCLERHRGKCGTASLSLRPQGRHPGLSRPVPCLVQSAYSAVGATQEDQRPRVPDRTAGPRLAHAARLPALASARVTGGRCCALTSLDTPTPSTPASGRHRSHV